MGTTGARWKAAYVDSITVTGAVIAATVDGRDVSADGTKLDGIEASADVTDTTNVTAAGALMDSELTNLSAVKAINQGLATSDSPTFAGATTTGHLYIADQLVHASDTNTKIRFPEVDTIAFNTAGVERLRINASGGISASSEISASSFTTEGNVSASKVYAADGLYHSDDSDDTYVKFTTGDKVQINAGGVEFMLAHQVDAGIK